MKREILLIALILISISGCAQKNKAHEIVVAFYNCENFFDNRHDIGKEDEEFTPEGKYHYTDRIYQQKLHNIAKVIKSLGDNTNGGIAILGMAEVENDHVLTNLINQPEIAQCHYKYVWFNGPDVRGINVAMLYNPKHFRVIKTEPLHVSLNGFGGKQTTRDVLHVYGILEGDTVHVFINHWPSRRGEEGESEEKRAIAAKVDRQYIDSLEAINPATRIIVMGDLNDNPTDASVIEILKAKGSAQETGIKDLYNPWLNIYNSGIGTLAYKHQWDLFDQIMFTGAFLRAKHHALNFDKAEIFKPDFLIDHYKNHEGYPHRSFAGTYWINGYSDHFPVIVYFSKKP